MAKVIETQFDQDVALDVALEQIDGKPPAVQTTLKNAENVYKSFLYLRKMYSKFPTKQTILAMSTVDYASLTPVNIPEYANYILVNNFSGSTAEVSINGNVYTMQPSEKEQFPITAPDTTSSPAIDGDTLEIKGTVSYIIKNIQDF